MECREFLFRTFSSHLSLDLFLMLRCYIFGYKRHYQLFSILFFFDLNIDETSLQFVCSFTQEIQLRSESLW